MARTEVNVVSVVTIIKTQFQEITKTAENTELELSFKSKCFTTKELTFLTVKQNCNEYNFLPRYNAGDKIKVQIDLSTNHLGHFEFNICELKNENDVETEECFDEHPLDLVDKTGEISRKYVPGTESGIYDIEVYLPENFKCEHCVLRWHYRTGNSWGLCDKENSIEDLGCGEQENFRSCADIAIV